VANFGTDPFDLGAGTDRIVLGSAPDGRLPSETTAWIAPVA
jgi:alpha-glucosidase